MILARPTVTALALTVASGAAGAAQLTFIGSGNTQVLARNDLGLWLNGWRINFITGNAKTTGNGLSLTARARPTFTCLGFEAGNRNYAARGGSTDFANGVSTVESTVAGTQLSAGRIDFAFGTSAPKGAVGLFPNDGLANPASKKPCDRLQAAERHEPSCAVRRLRLG